ncbi:hypothetical protein D3C81_1789620 [compost metagenome]
MVLNIAGGEGCSFQSVFARIDGCLVAGNECTFEVSIALHLDIEPTVPGTDA